MENTFAPDERSLDGIAIIGMACRFPKADNINQFWDNLIKGVDCIQTFPLNKPENPDVASNKRIVPRGGRINQPEMFDASFFGFNPREASLIDPQHRIFLECGYEAIENSGYDVTKLKCSVGVFASCGMNHYLFQNIMANPSVSKNSNEIQIVLGNDKDFLTTRLSYKLNLHGPSYDIQAACSSSLVAIHIACLNLLTYQCDMALAGGVFLQIPWWNGYMLADGDIRSPDGVCRPFDKNANGTVFGEGAGIVVLKRLQDAIKDQDHIYAVIKGSAVNNDGGIKAGYTSPSIEGQSEVISLALDSAGIKASDISYIEAHGTGTPIGDPIEITALTNAFRKYTDKNRFCAIGAVKSSIGHLDAAAGIAGLIKTALALHYRQIPPTINFISPNPLLNIENTPFVINDKLISWDRSAGQKRYAGVSSLGVGGTNAHIILEEAPEQKRTNSPRSIHFFPVSSKSSEGLKTAIENLSVFLNRNKSIPLADCAYTLQNGRQVFKNRSFLISESSDNKLSLFKSHSEAIPITKTPKSQKIVFMFSGQGSQYVNMGGDLYIKEPAFKDAFDSCSKTVRSITDISLCNILYHSPDISNISDILKQTRVTQPLLFSFEYALVKLWQTFGINPDAMIGHSIGEYVAACVAGVISLEDALYLVCERGRIMQMQPAGAMLSINVDQTKLSELIGNNFEISVINTPHTCVVSGTDENLEKLSKKLINLKIDCKPVNTSHAFHSSMMDGAVEAFDPLLKNVTLNKPSIPFISNVTGDYFSDDNLSDKSYWGKHLRSTVKFSNGILKLVDDGYRIFLEAGPGSTLVSFVNSIFLHWKKSQSSDHDILSLASVRNSRQQQNDDIHFINAIGKLWQHEINIDFSGFYKNENRKKAPLPTYPFERKRFWIDPVINMDNCIGLPGFSKYSEKIDVPLESIPIASVKGDDNSDLFKIVGSIWEELLGLDSVEPDKNFFEYGGDSIWASQLLSRIKDKIKVEVPLSVLYKAPSINGLVNEIRKLKQNGITPLQSGPVKSVLESDLPLSSSQLRLWFLNKLNPDSPAYNLATLFDINGPFKSDCALRAIESVVERHDVFRTTFDESVNGPSLHIHKRLNFKFESLDLSNSVCSKETWVNEIRTRSVKPYDLSNGPLLRILIITLSENHHILSVMTHHIITDGWSMSVFLKDFTQFYHCFTFSIAPTLRELPYRFADYTKWQHNRSANLNNDSIDYWKNTLSAPLPVMTLPTFKDRPLIRTFEGSAISFSIDKSASQKIESLSKNGHTTVFTILLGIFYTLLYRYSGQQDIIIGSPVANRNSTEVEDLIGFFLNMVPLRINCPKVISFKELLELLKNITTNAFAHQDVPFDRLVEIGSPQRELNHHPVYQVMFAFQNFPLETIKIDNTTFRPSLVNRGASEYDLSLYMWMESGTLNGFFEYSTELFDKELIENMSNHFVNIILNIIDNPDLKISDIPLLNSKETEKIIGAWNNTDQFFSQTECVHDLFDKFSKLFPEATAVISEDGSFTYNDLDSISDRIAFGLIKKGIGKGECVGVYLNRSSEIVPTLLGILKSGAGYVPLDPNLPQDRLAYMVEDSGLKIIITQQSLQSSVPSTQNSVSILYIETDFNHQFSFCKSELSGKASPDSLAYLIYTSGSTGKPKGVRIQHRSAVNFLTSMQQKPGISQSDIVLAITTLSFDISVLEIFLPLTVGACTAVISHESTRDPSKLISLINEINPTIIQGTPSTWKMLLSAGWKGSDKIKALCGGEPLTADLVKVLFPIVNSLWNLYGPTETTVWATLFEVTDPNMPVFIGYPINNIKAYILDSNMQPVPIGVEGELFIGGVGLAEGYHRREELNNTKFVINPFGAGRLYKTGDIARFHFNGAIDFIGRSDFQVKLRGYRIELGEIENITLSNSAINQCAAACKEFNNGDTRLVLFYTVKPNASITSFELRTFLKTFLPDYMIPQHFYELESMPLSASGKINRIALPISVNTTIIEPAHHTEPISAEELYIANIWKQILGIGQVNLNDNFFELGGHSLLSIKVISRIKSETGVEINPRVLVLNTLGQIASSISLNKAPQDIPNTKKDFSFTKALCRFFRIKT